MLQLLFEKATKIIKLLFQLCKKGEVKNLPLTLILPKSRLFFHNGNAGQFFAFHPFQESAACG